MSSSADIVIIGAGVIGLAIAASVSRPGRSVWVLEKNESFGRETSSRHSGVIHAGLYYEPGSLKARLCVEGNRLMYEMCSRFQVPHRRLGKIIVALDDAEGREMERLQQNALSCGATGLRWLTRGELQVLEPHVRAAAGLMSVNTGIVDSHHLMRVFAGIALEAGAHLVYRTEVASIIRCAQGYQLGVMDSSGGSGLAARIVINAAGLAADTVAAMAGINVDRAGYRLKFCKGQYCSVSHGKGQLVSRLIFPLPEAHGTGLGVHVVLDLDGRMRLGPDTRYVPRIDYSVDSGVARRFYDSAARFLPFLEPDDIEPESAGIRPKLQGPGEEFRDFVIREETDRGLPGLIDLVGLESPGLTSSPAIGRLVATMVDEILDS